MWSPTPKDVMKMKCKEARLLISVEADGEITQRDKAALESHVHECVGCRQERRSVRALRNTLSVWETPQPSESLRMAFAHRLRQEQEARERSWLDRWAPRLPVYAFGSAAVAAGVILLVSVVNQPRGPVEKFDHRQVAQKYQPQIPQNGSSAPEKTVTSEAPGAETPTQAVQPAGEVVALAPQPGATPVVESASARPAHVATSKQWKRYHIRRYSTAKRPVRPTMAAVAVAPRTASMAAEFARSARAEAEQRIAEKALRLKSLLAEADDTVERALISPAVDMRTTAPGDSEIDFGTPV